MFVGYSPTQKGYRCYSPEKRKYFVIMGITFFENQPYFPKISLRGENGSKENFWDLFQIITPTPFPISKPKLESNKTPIAHTNILEQPPLNPSITQPISLKNLPTISPNQPATTISLENLSAIAPNQPTTSKPSEFQSTVVVEYFQVQPTTTAKPCQLQSITTIEPVVPTINYNIRLEEAQQHQQELRVYSQLSDQEKKSPWFFSPVKSRILQFFLR